MKVSKILLPTIFIDIVQNNVSRRPLFIISSTIFGPAKSKANYFKTHIIYILIHIYFAETFFLLFSISTLKP